MNARLLSSSLCLGLILASCGTDTLAPTADAGFELPSASCLDNDGDGFNGTGDCASELLVDCDDDDPSVYPGAPETCNGRDDSCDGQVDEGLTVFTWYEDADGDGYGSALLGEGCSAPTPGAVSKGGDCNDADADVNPAAAEVCNGVDDDCNGQVDDGLVFQDFSVDADGDGFGDPASTPVRSCEASLAGHAPNALDCNDGDPTVKPGAVELCNKVDDDCDGLVDNGITFTSYWPDVDGDGYGNGAVAPESSCAPVPGKVPNGDDCDDANPGIKPGAAERCNGVDDNCNGQVDEGLTFTAYWPDADGDGFGAATGAPVQACAPLAGRVTNDLDCNDANPTIKPGATELCNGVDDDCNGQIDDGLVFTNYYPDADGDGFGSASAQPLSSCQPVTGRVTNNLDCNDANPTIKPGAAELCNGVDDDCNGQIDDGLTFTNYYPDADGDGFGSASAQPLSSCQPVAGRVTSHVDCDDTRAAVHPGATEVCNGIDDDCDGQVDEGLTFTNWYLDLDGDGFGAGTALSACSQPAGRVANATDCNDASATTHPGAPELCNGVDDNCDGLVDNGVATQQYYPDNDGDGYGSALAQPQASCAPVAGKVPNKLDCDDTNAAIRPGAAEVCNGVDDNCNGQVDEGLTFSNYYPDLDSDGYGSASAQPQSSCKAVAGKVTNNTDCNDANGAIHPGATETCNGVDDDCDGQVDEGLATQSYYVDADGDGYGASGSTAVASCRAVSGRVTNSLDCNDANAAIRPGAAEACNGVDDNCNGQVDEGNPGGGGACSTGQSGVCAAGTLTCGGGVVTCVRNVAPSAERCNGLDDDCDGFTDEDFSGLGVACSVGVGVCLRSGTTVCNAAQTAVVCSVTAGSPTAPACDGLDNDCDGVVDEPVITSTVDVSTAPWADIEVQPWYYSASGCAGGAVGTGSDARAGGGVAMGVGQSGIGFQPLTSAGAPTGGSTTVTSLTYTDVDLAQAGDGFVIAGIWAYSAEVDIYYVDATGAARTYRYSQFKDTSGNTIDSLRVVRGNGKRVTVLWRNSGLGVQMAQVEPCLVSGAWELRAPGCGTTTLTTTTLVSSAQVEPGLGVDAAHVDWAASQSCAPTSSKRRLGVAYRPNAYSLAFLQVDEDGGNKSAASTVYTVTSPRTLTEPDVAYFQDGGGVGQYLVAYVNKDPAGSGDADLDYWLTNSPSWHWAYLAYATQNGADSIARPRVSASGTELWMTALRYLLPADEPSAFKRQVMFRKTDLLGTKVPTSNAVEISPTFGTCGDAACRPGDKAGFTSNAAFGRVYYSGSGSTPSGTWASTLTCN